MIQIFRPSFIKEEFYYCFVTKLNDDDSEEDWEGTVGQLKGAIEEATSALQQNLILAVEEMTKKSTEKIINNLLSTNKSEMDFIEKV